MKKIKMIQAAVVEEKPKLDLRVYPKKGIEYIYLLDMVWKKGEVGHLPMEYGSIMIDVEYESETRLGFTHKETGEHYHCHYGWALAENTPENREKIDTHARANEILDNLQRHVSQLRHKIIDLDRNQ